MRSAIVLLCTEHCSLIPHCLPLLQVVVATGYSLVVGFGLREIRLEDDLRREALMPYFFCKNLCKTFLLYLVSLLKSFHVKEILIYILLFQGRLTYFSNLLL